MSSSFAGRQRDDAIQSRRKCGSKAFHDTDWHGIADGLARVQVALGKLAKRSRFFKGLCYDVYLERSVQMFRLVYTSEATSELLEDGIDQILTHARQRNARDGLTGILLFHKGAFLQALEGPQPVVEASFARIRNDARHQRVKVVSASEASGSLFDDWKIGHAKPGDLAQDVSDRAMTLVQVHDWLDDVACSAEFEKQNVFYMICQFLRGLGDIDARLGVDFLQCYDVDRRKLAANPMPQG